MPSATHAESPTLSSGKKRRRDDNGQAQIPFNLTHAGLDGLTNSDLDRLVFHNTSPAKRAVSSFADALQRKIRPLPSGKRMRVSDDAETRNQNAQDGAHTHSTYSTPPISPQLRSQSAAPTTSTSLLSPCHICHRKPTKKSDLDSFANCEGCGQRTCYVCIRQCQGWLPNLRDNNTQQDSENDSGEVLSRSFTMQDADDEEQLAAGGPKRTNGKREGDIEGTGWRAKGHGSVICSRCCVERGSEGDVMCLGCLAGLEGA